MTQRARSATPWGRRSSRLQQGRSCSTSRRSTTSPSRRTGKTIASAYGGEIVLTHAATGKELRRIAAHEEMIFGLSFAPDGKTIASAGRTDLGRRCETKLWDLSSQPAK